MPTLDYESWFIAWCDKIQGVTTWFIVRSGQSFRIPRILGIIVIIFIKYLGQISYKNGCLYIIIVHEKKVLQYNHSKENGFNANLCLYCGPDSRESA